MRIESFNSWSDEVINSLELLGILGFLRRCTNPMRRGSPWNLWLRDTIFCSQADTYNPHRAQCAVRTKLTCSDLVPKYLPKYKKTSSDHLAEQMPQWVPRLCVTGRHLTTFTPAHRQHVYSLETTRGGGACAFFFILCSSSRSLWSAQLLPFNGSVAGSCQRFVRLLPHIGEKKKKKTSHILCFISAAAWAPKPGEKEITVKNLLLCLLLLGKIFLF